MKLVLSSAGDDVLHVSVSGNITQRELSPLNDPLVDLLGPEAFTKTVVMDLSDAEYVDSSGIGWLLGCHKRFRHSGGKLVLHSLRPVVSNVVRVLKLDTVFELAGDQHAALLTAEGKTA